MMSGVKETEMVNYGPEDWVQLSGGAKFYFSQNVEAVSVSPRHSNPVYSPTVN